MTPAPRIVVFFQLVLIVYSLPDVEYIRETCNRRCESNLIYSSRNSGFFCDKDCSVLQCQDGCNVFPDVLNSSCSQACSEGVHQKINTSAGLSVTQDEIKNCVQGCVFALDEYADTLSDLLTPMPQPTLVRNSVNYSSVFLNWKHDPVSNVTYIIHKKVLDTSSDWQRHREFEFFDPDKIKIMRLHPYVTYQFKILAVVTPLPRHVFESPPTVPITTLAHGVPASAPKILRLSAPSPTVISMYWAAPVFPNGKLLGYRINLSPVGHAELRQTTLEVPPNVTSWTFSQCQSSQLYVFSLSAWNLAGEGPADIGNITTPNPGNLSASETPYLVLGADNKVIKSNILDAASVPDTVTTESPGKTIKGIGVHVRRQLIVVSDSDGQVSIISLTGDHTRENHYPGIPFPTAISVDWLADRVYIAGRKRIYNCPLDRDMCFVAIDNLASNPTDVKVDPVNGYLYFALHGTGGGLYRVDLTHIHRAARPKPVHIVRVDDLSAFIVDFDNVQLYFPKFFTNTSVDTIMSSFLDGSNMKDFRPNVVKRAYDGITSLIYYDGNFFWTDGQTVWCEEFDPGFSAYRHNQLLFFEDSFSGFNLFHPKAQPTPVPLTAPVDVEVLFTPNRAQIRWQPPPRLQYQGMGAWSQWTYDIELQDVLDDGSYGHHIQTAETSALNHTVENLTPDTVYHVRVRAKSEAGTGPWSSYFVGRTLQQEAIPVRVLMGVPGKIIEKDLSQLTHTTVVNFYSEPVDLSWHGDLLLWTTMNGALYVYNRQNSSKHNLLKVNHAYSVAYDWLGGKVFWSEPKDGVIRRSDMRGLFPEFIYQAEARDIAIDSLNARLYWATTNSIDSAYLNGENHVEIFSVPFFSGRHVISLALNFDLGKVMWYVKGYDSQELYMADLIGVQGKSALEVLATVRSAGSFHSISQTSGLQYYSHRLFWVDSVNALVVGDMQCNYTSVVAPFNNVTSFAVAHPSMQDYPVGMSEDSVSVIPGKIKQDSIRTVGHWSNFNLTWSTDSTVNHGTLFYKLYLKIGKEQIHKTMSENWYNVRGQSPFRQMVVSLQPYTYWGYAEAVTLSITSPMSKPTAPQTPRVYVTQHKNASTSQHSLAADFRWSTPRLTNGILSHHIITYWQSGRQSEGETLRVPGTSRHFILTPLASSGTYYFEVEACTEAGCGPKSELVSATTDSVNPVPMLMLAMASGVSLSEFDSDLHPSIMLPKVSTSALAYLAQDNRTFWIEHSDSLYVSQNSQQKELFEMTGIGLDLAMDWISRTLYVVENASSSHNTNSIMGYHIDQDLYQPIITTQNHIGSVISDPYTSMLLWTEIDSQGHGSLLSAPLDSKQSHVIIGKDDGSENRHTKRSIFGRGPCSDTMNVSPVIAMDYTRQGTTEVVFVDVTSNTILASDINGFNCSIVYRPPPGQVNGLPPSLLAVDHLRVYWYNKTEGQLYSINKDTGSNFQTQHLPGVEDILAYGNHLQPLPDSECLDPGAYHGNISAQTITNTSATLNLQPVTRPEQCHGISIPQDKYTVYYRKWLAGSGDCSIEPDDCMKKEVYSTTVELTDLDPYTDYMVQVAVSNYYTEYLAEALSELKTFTTRAGIPYSVRDVEAIPASPVEIYVAWYPPQLLNGPTNHLTYVVHYSTVTKEGHIIQKTEQLGLNMTNTKDNGKLFTILKDLDVNHTYDVKVQACMKTLDMCNDSVVVQARTFPEPSDIKFLSATHDSISVVWRSPPDHSIIRHTLEFAEVREGDRLEWQQRIKLPTFTVADTAYNETFHDLVPNMRYAFRCRATYVPPAHALFVWPRDITQAMFRTEAWMPERPMAPEVRPLKSESYEVVWEEPEDNGDQIQTYALQFCEVSESEWGMAYNGPEQRWVVDETLTRPGVQYVFRVAASNAKGWSPYSANSSVFLSPPAAVEAAMNQVTIGAIASVCAVVVLFIAVIVPTCVCVRRQREEKKKQQLLIVRGPDTELANLRQHPQSTFLQSNTLYGLPFVPTDADIAALPHVCRDQLDLTQFLGSGAFGEVYEGVARDILPDNPAPVKCAIKTLRKAASDHEKDEFLKEAVLMRNFQYEHILGLLGVCLDNDPHFIIMELMEGGDLLTFLRSSRASSSSPAKLMLPDLVKICVHVAKGCKYLEDKHFVHRDLAARNCLVSCSDPENMVVKIGDFGLAREVYTQDYYRKVGEGLLPVRWMSPESLVDGVFTTQSDIWAFGVLMWEVLTLGQQPYPARTNIEVLHFVRAGGKLERPDKCTDEMFNLMQRCWSFSAEERPCFAYLLQQLEMCEEKCSRMSPEEIALHSPTGADAPVSRPAITGHGSTSSSDGSTCSSSSSVASATQVQVYVPQSPSRRTRRRGGSERLTPASKKKRLVRLLGGEDKEKLVVDIPGMGRSRTASLDSKRSSVSEASRLNYTMAQFAAGRAGYDAMGYLEPRPRRMPQYLHLLNHAPELLLPEFQDGRAEAAGINISPQHQQMNGGSAFRPVGPYSRAVFTACQYSPTGLKNDGERVGSNAPTPTSPCHPMSSPVPFMSNSSDSGQRSSSSSSQTYGVVTVQEPTVERLIVDLTDVNRIKASQRKFSDQDLYSSPAQYNQQRRHRLSSSSATSDHPYSRVMNDDMNNNCNSGSSARTTPIPILLSRDRPLNDANVSRLSSFDPNLSYSSIRSKGPSLRGGNRSASESDSVFEEEEEFRYPPPYVNVQGQRGSGSRGQVYPANALAGYDITHASLV